MVLDDCVFDFGVEPAIDAADSLHQSHRVPVQIVVDQARRILKV